jgi:hypothetical protein
MKEQEKENSQIQPRHQPEQPPAGNKGKAPLISSGLTTDEKDTRLEADHEENRRSSNNDTIGIP